MTDYQSYGNLIYPINKTEFLLSYSYVRATTSMHNMDANKTHAEKASGNYTRILCAISNKSWQQDSTKQQLYGHLPPITQTIQDEHDMLGTDGEANLIS